VSLPGHTGSEAWLVDSGATHYCTPNRSSFRVLRRSRVVRIWLADSHSIPVEGEGEVWVKGAFGPVRVQGVLYAPELSAPLLSVSKVYDHGGRVEWEKEYVELFGAQHKEPCLVAHRHGAAWYVPMYVEEALCARLPKCGSSEGACLQGVGTAHKSFVAAVRGSSPA
jgi:hypothetical protein